MKGIIMNLNQVRYLLMIHETGSIRQAADNLFISAPSISTAIKNLEDELGYPLLLRHHNGVSFTEEGEEAILLMKELEDIINKLHHLHQDMSIAGEVTIGVSLHVKASLFLPTLLICAPPIQSSPSKAPKKKAGTSCAMSFKGTSISESFITPTSMKPIFSTVLHATI